MDKCTSKKLIEGAKCLEKKFRMQCVNSDKILNAKL